MKILVLLLFLYSSIIRSFAQTEPTEKDSVFSRVEKMPAWQGCDRFVTEDQRNQCTYQKIQNHLASTIRYPEEAKMAKQTGTVYVSFIIKSSGKIEEINIVKSASPSLDDEALRSVKLMPVWVPGEKDGEKVDVQYNLPISFNLR